MVHILPASVGFVNLGISTSWLFGTCVWRRLFALVTIILCNENNWGNACGKYADIVPASIDLLDRRGLFSLRPW